jgi:hypothetical protein
MVRAGGRKKSTPNGSVNQGTEGEVVFVHFAAIDKHTKKKKKKRKKKKKKKKKSTQSYTPQT